MARPTNQGKPERFLRLPPVAANNAELAGQAVVMFGSPKGIDRYHLSSRVDPEAAVKIRNLMFDDGLLVSRLGTDLMGGEAASTVMQVVDVVRKGQKKVTVRFCLRHVEIFEYGLGAWRSFAVPLTGSERDFFAYTGWADKLLFSNGVDGLWEIDFKTLVIKLVPGGPSAKHLTTFGNRVVASSTVEGGEDFPLRVRWTAKNDYTRWAESTEAAPLTLDLVGGHEDLYGSPGGSTDEAMGVFPFSDEQAWLVRSKSTWQMSVSGNVLKPFRFSRVFADIGTPYRNTIVSTTNGIIFASRENIYSIAVGGSDMIGLPVMGDIEDEVETLKGSYATFDSGRLEYRIASGTLVWRYRMQEKGWTADEYPNEIRSLSRQIQGVAGIPIDNLPGIIDDLSEAFPPGAINDLVYDRSFDDAMMFVPESSLLTLRETDDPHDVLLTGEETDSEFVLESGVLTLDPLEAIELHGIHGEYEAELDQQLIFEITGNDGQSWNPYSLKDIEPTEGSEIWFNDVKRVSRKLRFRIRSTTLGQLRLLGTAVILVKVSRAMPGKKPRPASIQVLPSPISLQVGGTQQLSVRVLDASGHQITGMAITLVSSDNTVATVSSTGLVRAIAAGSFAIVASVRNVQVSVQGTVSNVAQAAVGSVTVLPSLSHGTVGSQQQFSATVRDVNNNVLVGKVVTWGSSNNAIATVNSSGLVTLVAIGTAVISATCEGITGGATLTVEVASAIVTLVDVSPTGLVMNVGDTLQLTATPKDVDGVALSGKTISWSSSAPSIATVSALGLVTFLAAGAVTITATCETVVGTTSFTVVAAVVPVATVTVTPSVVSRSVGATQQLTATTKDSSGNVLTGRTVTWSSDNTSIATVTTSGLVTMIAQGSTTVRATSEGKVGTSAITVTQASVASVTLSPPAANIVVGGSVQLTATVRDAVGNVLVGRVVTWGSSDPTIATVSNTGLVTAVAAGSANITASSEGITVTNPAIISVAAVGGIVSIPLTVRRFAAGTASTLVHQAIWLPPGPNGITAADLANVKFFIEGAEKQIFIKALTGKHPDGKLRAILIQATHTLSNGTDLAGELRIGEARTTVDIAETAVADIPGFLFDTTPVGGGGYTGLTVTQKNNPMGYGYADGVALPSSAAYLLSCNAVDPSMTYADTTALGGSFAALEAQLASYSDQYATAFATNTFATYGAASPSQVDWTLLHNQYDRAFNHFELFARTANPEYYRRACAYSWFFQSLYARLGSQEGQFNEHFQGPEGAMLHYWSTGDPLSKEYVVAAATRRYELWQEIQVAGRRLGEKGPNGSAPGEDPRITGQVLNLCRCAWELEDTSFPWNTRIELLVDKIYGINLSTGGIPARRTSVTPASYTGAWIIGDTTPGGCSISTNFMLGFLSKALMRYYERYKVDSRIQEIIQGFVNFLETQWRDPASLVYMVDGVTIIPAPSFSGEVSKSYNYLSGSTCPGDGGAGVSVDLNGFWVGMYQWLAKKTGNTAYATRAEYLYGTLSLTHDGNAGPNLNNVSTDLQFGKQYNEWMFDYARYLAYR